MDNTTDKKTVMDVVHLGIDEVNRVETHIWALLLIAFGVICYFAHQPVAGTALVSGGLAVFQKTPPTAPKP